MNYESKHWDRTTAIAGIIIALCALSISIWQGYLSREHNRLSVKPLLVINLDWSYETKSSFHIHNSGLGPAKIKQMYVFLDGRLLNPNEGLQIVGDALIASKENIIKKRSLLSAHYLHPGDIVDKGDVVNLLSIPEHSVINDKVDALTNFFAKRVKIQIEYCSLYDQCEQLKYPNWN